MHPFLAAPADGSTPPSSMPWAIVGRFLEKHGLSGAIVLMLAWLMWSTGEDRRAEVAYTRVSTGNFVLQLKDLNGQLLHLSNAFTDHAQEGTQIIQVLRVMCVNAATTPRARARCLGEEP